MSHAHAPLPFHALKNAQPLATAVATLSNAYAFVVASLSSAMRPQLESPAEAATRLRLPARRQREPEPPTRRPARGGPRFGVRRDQAARRASIFAFVAGSSAGRWWASCWNSSACSASSARHAAGSMLVTCWYCAGLKSRPSQLMSS